MHRRGWSCCSFLLPDCRTATNCALWTTGKSQSLVASRIPREEWVRAASECTEKGEFKPGLYHRRWEIETTYRELKVEQGLNGNLRGRTPESIQFEVAGHVVLYFLVRWLMVEAAMKHGLDPLRLSFKNAFAELLEMHSSLVTAKGRWVGVLLRRLLDRIAEHQVPHRPGRSYSRRKQSTNHKRKSKHPKNTNNTKRKTTKRKTAKRSSAKPKTKKRTTTKSRKKSWYH